MKELFIEKYRPVNIKDYVFRDDKQKRIIESWITDGIFPHLLLSGSPGVGKTSLAKVLLNECQIEQNDVMIINSSSNNGIDVLRDTIYAFVTTIPFGKFRVIILDEFDHASLSFQTALRNMMETYADDVRFILTCNYPHKIIPAIHSRCQSFHIEKLNKSDFDMRVANILFAENIEFNIEIMDNFINATYPDLRKCLNLIQQNIIDNKLTLSIESVNNTLDYMVQAVQFFKQKDFRKGREIICKNAKVDDIENIFTWCYNNLDLFASSDDKKDDAILIIRDGLVKHISCANAELNLSATLIQLSRI